MKASTDADRPPASSDIVGSRWFKACISSIRSSGHRFPVGSRHHCAESANGLPWCIQKPRRQLRQSTRKAPIIQASPYKYNDRDDNRLSGVSRCGRPSAGGSSSRRGDRFPHPGELDGKGDPRVRECPSLHKGWAENTWCLRDIARKLCEAWGKLSSTVSR